MKSEKTGGADDKLGSFSLQTHFRQKRPKAGASKIYQNLQKTVVAES